MQDVHAIEIAGFISLNKVSIENLEKPCDFEKNTKKYAGGVTNQVEMYRSKEPVLLALSEDSSFNCTLAGGIIDREVVLKGYTFATHERIYVLLKEMTSNDIAFQFEVRFDQRKCVINSFECGTWKKELEINHLPFQNNMDFTQVDWHLKEMRMGQTSAWGMARRRPLGYRQKVESVTCCSSACSLTWPDLT
uniref:Galectin domain-containing protein n=1 Tax=Eptatretus burgeri TaxID=7764 RepID=A0A8C4NAT0_EPTBU